MLTQYLTTACNSSFLSTTNERERERERERGRERTTHCCCVPKKALIECHALKKDLTQLDHGANEKRASLNSQHLLHLYLLASGMRPLTGYV
jgi:hypothetical protein